MVNCANLRARGATKVNDQQSQPASGGLPERGKAIAECILRSRKKRARANPGGEQGKHQHVGRQRAPRHQVVGLGMNLAHLPDADREQRGHNHREYHGIKIQHLHS